MDKDLHLIDRITELLKNYRLKKNLSENWKKNTKEIDQTITLNQ